MLEPSPLAQSLTHSLSALTILGSILLVLWILLSVSQKGKGIQSFFSRYALQLGFFATLLGTFLTLLYSEVFHYAPCDLCWFQRAFLYPQLFIFGLAWYRKDRSILPYALLLSLLGLAIALYHHALQMGYDIYKPCSTALFAVDCSVPSFIEFGFVTFPFMAVVLFGFLVLLNVTALHLAKRS